MLHFTSKDLYDIGLYTLQRDFALKFQCKNSRKMGIGQLYVNKYTK